MTVTCFLCSTADEVRRISTAEPARMDGITICGIMLYLVSRVKNIEAMLMIPGTRMLDY